VKGLRGKWSLFLRLGVAILLSAVLLRSIGIVSLINTFANVKPIWGIFTLGCLVSLFFLGAFNVWLLLRTLQSIRFRAFLSAYSYGWALGLVIPGQLGDATLPLFLKRRGIPLQCSGISYLLDKAITLAVLCLVAWYGASLLLPGLERHWFLLFPFLGLLAVTIALALLKYFPARFSVVANLQHWFYKLLHEASVFRSKWYVLILNLLLTMAKCLLLSICYYVAFLSFNENVGWPKICIIPVLSTLVGYIPVSVGGIGTVEFAAVHLFSNEGVEPSIVLSVYLFLRLLQYVLCACMLIIFLYIKPSIDKLRLNSTHKVPN
jgi:uncharacterized membrane protein YbhN (UPF0104 family)